MKTQQVRTIYTFSLVILDSLMIVLAFLLAYWLRTNVDWPDELVNVYPLPVILACLRLQVVAIVLLLLVFRQYYIPRTVSRIDQFYNVVAAVTLGTLIAVALATLFFKNRGCHHLLPASDDRLCRGSSRSFLSLSAVLSTNLCASVSAAAILDKDRLLWSARATPLASSFNAFSGRHSLGTISLAW